MSTALALGPNTGIRIGYTPKARLLSDLFNRGAR